MGLFAIASLCTGSRGSLVSLSLPVLVTLSLHAGLSPSSDTRRWGHVGGICIRPKKILPIGEAASLPAGGCHGNAVP